LLGAVKCGLNISATRMVHFGQPSAELREKHRACCYLDACFNLETRPGASVAAIFSRAVKEVSYDGNTLQRPDILMR